MLEVNTLFKSYLGKNNSASPVVRVREFSMKSGEKMALQGESGSGKTTFLHLIAGILSPDSGKILLNEVNISELPESQRDQLLSLIHI